MPSATGPWTCDSCGKEIATAADGWVEWVEVDRSGGGRARDLRLVHHRKGCQFNEREELARDGGTLADGGLDRFLGNDGLVHLLARLANGRHSTDEIIEMIQRLHVPGYEQARPYFEQALADGEIESNLPKGLYRQDDIQTVLARYR